MSDYTQRISSCDATQGGDGEGSVHVVHDRPGAPLATKSQLERRRVYPIQLLVGLANPGPEYAKTRHNAGAWLVEAWAANQGLLLTTKPKFHGLYAKTTGPVGDLHVLIPETFMNLSGKAVAAIASFYKIPPEAILVLHDELDLAPGKLRLKQGGGHAGHNGLKDIERAIGSRDFWRLRIGIGHPGVRELVTPYVLGKPSPEERLRYEDAIAEALSVIPELLAGHMNQVMAQLH